VFPVSLDTDAPAFRAGLRRLRDLQDEVDAAKRRGGLLAKLTQAKCALQAVGTFARLYLLPVQTHELPATIRMQPVW
jgi:magnesium-protoporphyrin IX monomethyl ester (oxidative) cyclase